MNTSLSRPVIGITCAPGELVRFGLWRHFFHGFVAAGATPVTIDCTTEQTDLAAIVGSLDGLVISGGGDVDPSLYGGDRNDVILRGVDDMRDTNEQRALETALERGMPVLAVCRGFQLVNVALGGTLHADLARDRPGGVAHQESDDALNGPLHDVDVRAGSLLSKWVGTHGTVPVNSQHHQGVAALAPALTAVAFAQDGLVEAAEWSERHLVGVQWHPEILWPYEQWSAALLRGFVAECGTHMPDAAGMS